MDTSHLAQNAGAASSFFASIFVVATLSMRTMIPLRVFAILTNILLIATAIPLRNYPTLVLHGVLLAASCAGSLTGVPIWPPVCGRV